MHHPKKKSINAFGFDLGNTLINDTRIAQDAVADICTWLFENRHIQSKEAFLTTYTRINRDTKKPFISHTYSELEFFQKTFDDLVVSTISAVEALKKYREILIGKIHPDKDIVDAFRLIKARNMRIVLMSNESTERVNNYLKKTRLEPFFDVVVVSESLGVENPDSRFFQAALRQ